MSFSKAAIASLERHGRSSCRTPRRSAASAAGGARAHLRVADDDRALDGVLELADVARPVVAHQHVDRRRRDPLDVLPVLARELLEEVVGEQQDVRLPLAQRRHEDREHVQPVVEILAERSPSAIAFSRSLLVAAISRTSARIVCVPPSRSNSRSCSTRSSLTCVARLSSPISSRNSVPPSASSKRPFFERVRAGERALLVAEELRLDQILRQRRAVHLDERLLRARRVVVDRVRDQLLAGARLAAQQHRRVRRRDLRDLLVHLAASARSCRRCSRSRSAP